MGIGVPTTILLVCVCWSLCDRRATWRSPWEAAATLSIALQGAAAALTSSIGDPLGQLLHAITGRWQLENLLGHLCYIAAMVAIVYAVLSRLGDHDTLRAKLHRLVEFPVTLGVPLLLALLLTGRGTRMPSGGLFRTPPDLWMTLYRVALCALLVHLLLCAIRALMVLRRDPGHRPVATMYLAFCFVMLTMLFCQAGAAVIWGVGAACSSLLLNIAGVVFVAAHVRPVSRAVGLLYGPASPKSSGSSPGTSEMPSSLS